MLKKRPEHIYSSTLLENITGLTHGFSSRTLGDMGKNMYNRKKFIGQLGISVLPWMSEQVHGAIVTIATDKSSPYSIGVDGLVTNRSIPLGVVTADCVPLLFVDPKAHVVAAVHAGWKGTIGKIATQAIAHMEHLGAMPQDIVVAIGPHIGMCCYNVPEERASLFAKEYIDLPQVVSFFEGRWHLDIGYANYLQLVASGVSPDHIDAPPVCTSCQVHEFFSYRKDTKDTYGEIMGVIGFR